MVPPCVFSTMMALQIAWLMVDATNGLSEPTLIEGDIVLDERISQIINQPNGRNSRKKRDAVANHVRLWSNGIVPYVIDESIGAVSKKRIRRAFRQISKKSCIDFIPKTRKDKDYIKFIEGNGCYSSVGRKGGEQIISLDYRDCAFGVTHEIMHALGFFHEQSRPDRDRHVMILWWNIQHGMEKNFRSYPNGVTDTLGEPYDTKSIMHYGNKAFSKNGQDTIKSRIKTRYKLGGGHKKLSAIDSSQVNTLYKCPNRGRRHSRRTYCRDVLSGCLHYAVYGVACEFNFSFMRHYCRRGCGFCCGKRHRYTIKRLYIERKQRLEVPCMLYLGKTECKLSAGA